MPGPGPGPVTVGVLLAAGRSERFGAADKLLAPFRGVPLVCHAANAMASAGLTHRIAVTSSGDVARVVDPLCDRVITQASAAMSGTIRTGVAQARELGAERLLLVLGDMPFVTAAMLDRLVARCTDDAPAALTDGARIVPPACFPSADFDALSALRGDRGARERLCRLPPSACVRVPGPALVDIDDEAALARWDRAG